MYISRAQCILSILRSVKTTMANTLFWIFLGFLTLGVIHVACQAEVCLNGGTLLTNGACACLPNTAGERCGTFVCKDPDQIYCPYLGHFLCMAHEMFNMSFCPVKCGNCPQVLPDPSYCDPDIRTAICRSDLLALECPYLCAQTPAEDPAYCDPSVQSAICNSEVLSAECPILCANFPIPSVETTTSESTTPIKPTTSNPSTTSTESTTTTGSDPAYCDPNIQSAICNSELLSAECPILCACYEGTTTTPSDETTTMEPVTSTDSLTSTTATPSTTSEEADPDFCAPEIQSAICNSELASVSCPLLCANFDKTTTIQPVTTTPIPSTTTTGSDPDFCDPTVHSVICSIEILAAECPILCANFVTSPESTTPTESSTSTTTLTSVPSTQPTTLTKSPTSTFSTLSTDSTTAIFSTPSIPGTTIDCGNSSSHTNSSTVTLTHHPNTVIVAGQDHVHYSCKRGSVNMGGNEFTSYRRPDGTWTATNFLCVDVSTCYVVKRKMRVYSGTHSVASNGQRCQYWAHQYPNRHLYKDRHFLLTSGALPETLDDARNYCRDPTRRGRLWCFNGEGRRPRIVYCNDVPRCNY